jgi:methionine-S-sulfoxide reductase
MPGVIRTRVGYAGGTTDDPTYSSIGDHSETIQIDYNPDLVTFAELLDVFWRSHNPSARSFSRQYRSIIFFHNEQQHDLALDTKERAQAAKTIYTEILPFSKFFRAEDYHQKYYLRQAGELMGELRGKYSLEEDFTNSTVAARLNGYIGGFGSQDQLEQELDSFALSDQAEKYIRERLSRR